MSQTFPNLYYHTGFSENIWYQLNIHCPGYPLVKSLCVMVKSLCVTVFDGKIMFNPYVSAGFMVTLW